MFKNRLLWKLLWNVSDSFLIETASKISLFFRNVSSNFENLLVDEDSEKKRITFRIANNSKSGNIIFSLFCKIKKHFSFITLHFSTRSRFRIRITKCFHEDKKENYSMENQFLYGNFFIHLIIIIIYNFVAVIIIYLAQLLNLFFANGFL